MRRPQFSLKTLLWLMLFVAVASSVLPPGIKAYKQYRERRQWEELVQLIQETVVAGSDFIEHDSEPSGTQE